MTTVADPVQAPVQAPARRPVVLRRPRATTGWKSWFTTVDHKKIGIMYGATALIFFVIGGIEALLIRLQLAGPNGNVLTAAQYNQLFTMHGTTMVFLMGMPLAVAFGNYLVPIMIGARDVAFPRLNAFGYWVVLAGGIFLYSSFLLGGAPNGGWFGYTPLTSTPLSAGFLPGRGPDFWTVGLIMLGIGSTTSAINFIVTILNLRAPGMTLMRMPVFVWMMLVVAFLTLFAMPIITVALIMVFFDRNYGALFFEPAHGGDPLLYQHLFWLFGHPEVYILILPGMGIVSETLPVFSRKPLFGYAVVVFSGIAIGFLGWGVWAHHMFATGLGPVAISAFGLSTMLIAIPTGVKIFNWLATVWKGSVHLTTSMLFSLAFIAMFTIGGLSGVLHSIVPADTQQTDTYFVVAHFHYVLFGGLVLAIFGGFYYWLPKVFGRMLDERLGKFNFWTMLVGFNLTFFPMHLLGLWGMPRRTYRYDSGLGWDGLNYAVTIGAFLIAFSTLIFLVNVIVSITLKRGAIAGDDPWDGRTLEWSIPSPPPEYNFAEVPEVQARDDFWHRKYTEDDQGMLLPLPSGGAAAAAAPSEGHHIHMPSPSIYPFVVALGLPPLGYAAVFHSFVWLGIGVVVLAFGVYAWAIEPADDPEPVDDQAGPSGDLEHAGQGELTMATIEQTTEQNAEVGGHATHGAPGHQAPTATGVTNMKLMMWLFLASDCLFFGAFIAAYLLYRGRSTVGPGPKDVYDIPFTSATSFILLMSSLTMVLALAAIQRGDQRRLKIWLVATALLGATFIGGQVFEFTEFSRKGLDLSTNLFGSSFFVLTGFHGAHVTVGIIWLLSLWGLASQGRLQQHHAEKVEVAGLYWHFVDVVWIVIFTVVYLVPQPGLAK